MNWLLALALKNVVLALPLAGGALATQYWLKRPALAHLLWALVLVKLLTPPLVDVPVGWRIDPQAWFASLSARPGQSVAVQAVREAQPTPPAASRVTSRRTRPAPAASRASDTALHVQEPRSMRVAALSTVLAKPANWPRVAGCIWGVGSLLMALLYAYRAWRFRRFVRSLGPSRS